MAKYKEKICLLCQEVYIPTSPKQKFCSGCRAEGRRIGNRKKDRERSRKRYNYVEHIRNCKHCGIEFKTYYKKKVYCGAEECNKVRLYIKNQRIQARRPKGYMLEKGRRYYRNNSEKCIQRSAEKYRECHPNARPYVAGKPAKLTYNYVKSYIEERGYKLLSKEYNNNRRKLLLECPRGHKWLTTFHGFKDGNARCFWCYLDNNYTSKFELSVREYVNKMYSGSIIYNDRTQIMSTDTGRNLELDMWFPDLNKAIECNGVYWHSKNHCLKRDQLKIELCEQQNIDLLVVTDDEWLDETGKELVNGFIGKSYENLLG